MKIPLGVDYFDSKSNKKTIIYLDTEKLINPHLLILGASGVGKSYTFRKMIQEGIKDNPKIRFHLFDVHGDLHVDGASTVRFSEQASHGLNPFKVNPSEDFGGVRKCIQNFIQIINKSGPNLGIRQEAVLRSLLEDVYKDFGFELNDSSTWSINEYESRLVSSGSDNRLYLQVPKAEKDRAKDFGARWEPTLSLWWIAADKYKGGITQWPPAYKERTYPNLKDVINHANRLYTERFLGSDQKAVKALSDFIKTAKSYQKRLIDSLKSKNQDIFDEDIEASLELSKAKAVEAYIGYVDSVKTGRELENLMKYDTPEVLKSVLNRLINLEGSGVFKNKLLPFDPACPVWRYDLKPLSREEKKMTVFFLLQELYYKAIERGESSDVVEVIVLDELSTYTGGDDENGDGIIGIIAREARKFGLGLWAADQSPKKIPEGLISSVGTKIVLGIDENFWDSTVSKFKMDLKLLNWIVPQETLALQLKEKGSVKSRWRWASCYKYD